MVLSDDDQPTVCYTSAMRHPLRVSWRLAGFIAVVIAALVDFFVRWVACGGRMDYPQRSRWLNCWAGLAHRVLQVRVTCTGTPPARGMLVGNHLGYLDITVLSSLRPFVFVAKADVRRWPVIGQLATCAGSLFVRRDQRSDVVRLASAATPVVEQGSVLVLFPEGTSSDGRSVLPFHSSLLAPAASTGWPVTPAWITYTLADGVVADDVCYWRDMTFVPHFLNLLSKRAINAHVVFGTAITGTDRKDLARRLHAAVCGLGGLPVPPASGSSTAPGYGA